MTNSIIQVAPGKELAYAKQFGSKAFVPTRRVVWHNAGKRYEEDYAAASGYVALLDTDLSDPYLWHYAAGVEGYRRVIGTVRQKELDAFAAEVARTAEPERVFIPKIGQRVLVVNGIFAGQIGKAIWANKKYSKIFIDGACNQFGATPLIPTEHCAPAPKSLKAVESAAPESSRSKTRRGNRRSFRSKTAESVNGRTRPFQN